MEAAGRMTPNCRASSGRAGPIYLPSRPVSGSRTIESSNFEYSAVDVGLPEARRTRLSHAILGTQFRLPIMAGWLVVER